MGQSLASLMAVAAAMCVAIGSFSDPVEAQGTAEDLVYVVECGPKVTYRVHGFCFCVQSLKHNPVYLQERVEIFINGLEELSAELSECLERDGFKSILEAVGADCR